MRLASTLALALAPPLAGRPRAFADEAGSAAVSLKGHKVDPSEPTASAGKPLTVDVANLDTTLAAFESKQLRVGMLIPAGGKVTLQIRALSRGRYRFFDDYHEITAQGFLVVEGRKTR